jgi:hypothetical protein
MNDSFENARWTGLGQFKQKPLIASYKLEELLIEKNCL